MITVIRYCHLNRTFPEVVVSRSFKGDNLMTLNPSYVGIEWATHTIYHTSCDRPDYRRMARVNSNFEPLYRVWLSFTNPYKLLRLKECKK
jgi:hypothetical protein